MFNFNNYENDSPIIYMKSKQIESSSNLTYKDVHKEIKIEEEVDVTEIPQNNLSL